LSYTDVASVKDGPEREVLEQTLDRGGSSCYVGGHPLAGRELSGPLGARADLFQGRPWVLTPSRLTAKPAFDRALELIGLCGAVPVLMRSRTHDEAVALISHVPHLVASLMAARLRDCPTEASLLAGRGLRDVTRIAGGSSQLWGDILRANAPAVAKILTALQEDLLRLTEAIQELSASPTENPENPENRGMETLVDLLDRGIAGLEEMPGARAVGSDYATSVHVAVEEQPGELSRLLSLTSELGVGPEDATVLGDPEDEGPGLVVRFAVPPVVTEQLIAKLTADGWTTWEDS
jgi:prephenate dehydrogenase